MALTQVGGAGDGGVDLRGWWNVPSPPRSSPTSTDGSRSSAGPSRSVEGERRRIRVLGQCKAERKALGPRAVRELEGVMAHQRGTSVSVICGDRVALSHAEGVFAGQDVPDSIAVLLSQSGFSAKAMIHATRSSTPLLLVHLPGGQPVLPPDKSVDEDSEIEVDGAVWNSALGGPSGVLAGIFELRREILESSGQDAVTGDAEVKSRVGLWYNGERFKGLPDDHAS